MDKIKEGDIMIELKNKSKIELKAIAYDLLVAIQRLQNDLAVVNKQIVVAVDKPLTKEEKKE